MKTVVLLFLAVYCIEEGFCFTGDDKFIKKYAMMKVYESCFGPDVVKEVRKEMKLATAKCSGIQFPINTFKIHPYHHGSDSGHQGLTGLTIHKTSNPQYNSHTHNMHVHSSDNVHSANKHHTHLLSASGSSSGAQQHADSTNQQPSFDFNKLQQVILSGYNKHVQQHSAYPPSSSSSSSSTAGASSSSQVGQFSTNHNQYTPASNVPNYPANQNNQYQPPYINTAPPVYPPAGQYPAPVFYPPNSIYPAPAGIQQPYYPPPGYYQPPLGYPQYFPGSRISRDLDIRGQLETLTAKMSSRVRNVTCVMQELGYLDENLEPDYVRIVERINRLPVVDDLKRDMSDGVEFCKQFSLCVPDERKDKLAREMVRPMFFFRCYKHKKLEACIMKDVREKYSPNDDLGEDNLTSVGAEMRSLKNSKRRKNLAEEDVMAAAVYEFLDGENNFDFDAVI